MNPGDTALTIIPSNINSLIAPPSNVSDSLMLEINSFTVPSVPAYSLLGITGPQIATTSVGDIMTSISNATGNFTQAPTNYAVEISPFWMFGKQKLDYSSYISNKLWDNIKQSYTLSLAVAPGAITTNSMGMNLDKRYYGNPYLGFMFKGKGWRFQMEGRLMGP